MNLRSSESGSTKPTVNPGISDAHNLEWGTAYYRARYYDSAQGRFMSEDPIGFGGETDFYAYVQNRVLNEYDPTGLQQRDSRCPSWYPDFLCNWIYGKTNPQPPKPDSKHPICPCTRKSAAPTGKGDVCVYDCCPVGVYPDGSKAYDIRGSLVPLQTFKKKFPDQCKNLKDCPYQILTQFDFSDKYRQRDLGVVTGIVQLEP